jgi:hypothetical protein
MKKITFLLLLISIPIFAQQKSTGNIALLSNVSANLTLNSAASMVTLTISGPNDRWFACKFGSFTTAMTAGIDGVYFDGTTLVDGVEGGGSGLSADTTQNWTVTSNSNTSGTRTITATRPFNTGDSEDFTFVFANTTIAIAQARGNTAVYPLEYHGNLATGNRSKNTSVSLTTLGVEDFSLNATQIYPNPSKGDFIVKTKTGLDKINVYSQVGAFVKTIMVNNLDATEINIKGLSTGVYLLELLNASDKSWKKIIVN